MEEVELKVPVFVSRPSPHTTAQQAFVSLFLDELGRRNFEPVTMGPAEGYDYDAPLVGIRRMLTHCCGLVSIAFRRTYAPTAVKYYSADLPDYTETVENNVWFTSPYCQIEPAMAFQLGLPILVLREEGVLAEGILERGVTGLYLPEFRMTDGAAFLTGRECAALLDQWGSRTRAAYMRLGDPPKLYE